MDTFVLTSEEMYRLDRLAMEKYGVPSLTLMENAGRGVFEFLKRKIPDLKLKKIIVVAGKGNNGGDGFVVARHLLEAGAKVRVFTLAQEKEIRGEAAVQMARYREKGGEVRVLGPEVAGEAPWRTPFEDADLLIDAIFGIGFSGKVSAETGEIIEAMNRSQKKILAIDLPSGLSADSGKALGPTVRATWTVTLENPKTGLVHSEAADFVGELEVVKIGIPHEAYDDLAPKIHWMTGREMRPLITPRKKTAHKGDFGHLLLVGGSSTKPGAILLAGRAALRAGAGLVTVALPDKAFKKIPSATEGGGEFLELMYEPLPSTFSGTLSRKASKKLERLLEGKSAVAVGPGMGVNADTTAIVKRQLRECVVPTVFDADALNSITGVKGWQALPDQEIIFTPHPGEMGRLIGATSSRVQQDRLSIARDFAEKHGVSVVLKGFRTLTALPTGEVFINSTGNPGMATAGMGDVLTGVIGSLLAQGMRPEKAAAAGVYLHGRAGDRVAERLGDRGLLASDVIEELPQVFKEFL